MTNSAPCRDPLLRHLRRGREPSATRRRGVAPRLAAALLVGCVSGVAWPTSSAGAQAGVTTTVAVTVAGASAVPTTLRLSAAPAPDIIPQPNRGRAPSDAGERGGAWQEGLFFIMCGAIVAIGGLVWRESRAKRRQQGRLAPKSSPPSTDPIA